jgi:hypothetical protein
MRRRILLAVLPVLAVLAVLALVLPAAASAWAPAGPASVHPGVMTFTEGAQCTSNFVFQDPGDPAAGTPAEVYLGQAAHCSGTGAATDTNGCDSESLPLGTPVEIDGASRPGTLVYNSWITMQAKGEGDANTCAYNDLALVRIDPADVPSVNPSVPGFGGPTGVGTVSSTGTTVYSYGNSSLRLGVTKLSPKRGVLIRNTGGGWSHDVYTFTPGIPGDSGSGFFTGTGEAFGVLSTVQLAPLAASNGVGDLAKELGYMRANTSFSGVELVPGTESFNVDYIHAIEGA